MEDEVAHSLDDEERFWDGSYSLRQHNTRQLAHDMYA